MKGMKGMNSKFSLGVDTSAAGLKSDVKKNLTKKGGLGVDTSIDHDTSTSAAAIKKAIDAPTTKLTSGEVPELAKPESNMDRHRQEMEASVGNWQASKLKNISRGHYTGDQTATTTEGSIKTGGEWSPVTKTETFGNITKPGGGTGFVPKGKGSTVTSYEVDMEDEAPQGYGEVKLEPGDYRYDELVLGKTPKLSGKQKRQANRKERKEARYQKQSKKSMDIALKRQAKQENKKKKKTKTGNGDIVWKDEYRYDQDEKAAKQENK